MDTVSEQRLAQVLPALAEKVRQLADELAKQNIVIRVVQGLRTWAEQDGLYAQGRTAPGKVVTNCQGGHSYHNFGLAVDCAPSINGVDQQYQPDWNPSHPVWKTMESLAQEMGLGVGAYWRSFPDAPHLQLNGCFPVGAPNDEVRLLFKNGGLKAVWDALEEKPNTT